MKGEIFFCSFQCLLCLIDLRALVREHSGKDLIKGLRGRAQYPDPTSTSLSFVWLTRNTESNTPHRARRLPALIIRNQWMAAELIHLLLPAFYTSDFVQCFLNWCVAQQNHLVEEAKDNGRWLKERSNNSMDINYGPLLRRQAGCTHSQRWLWCVCSRDCALLPARTTLHEAAEKRGRQMSALVQ